MLKFKFKGFSFIYTLINSYLVTLFLYLLLNPQSNSNNFFELDNGLRPLTVFLLWGILFVALFLIEKYFHLETKRLSFFIILATIFLTGLSLLSPSPTIIVGILLLQFILLMFLYYPQENQRKLQAVVGTGLILSLLKIPFVIGPNDNLGDEFLWEFSSQNNNLLIIIFSAIALALLIHYLLSIKATTLLPAFKNRKKWFQLIFWAVVIFQTLLISLMLLARIKTFTSPTYDMGIFSQMFANMSKGLGPVTTLERDQVLSHFAVHISPIHYLLLPFYLLIPRPETIQVLQVLVVLSGILPFYLILKEFDFPKIYQKLLLFLYLWTPALTTGHFYDYHENCFLAPLLLWLFYFTIRKQAAGSLIVVALTLMVKEDAMIYVFSMGAYFLFQERFKFKQRGNIFIFITQIVIPLVYFLLAITWLQNEGDGAMTTRFTNFMHPGEDSLVNVIFNALSNPQYTLANFFTFEKLKYVLIVLGCQAFLPLMQANWSHYILFLPLLVINLFSDWPYQYDLFKQYHYGSNILLLLLTLLALDSLLNRSVNNERNTELLLLSKRSALPQRLTLIAVTVSLFTLLSLVQPRYRLVEVYFDNSSHYQSAKASLDELPRDTKILSFTRFTTPLSDVFYLYDLYYHNDQNYNPEIDFLVFERALLKQDKQERAVVSHYLQNGYRESDYSTPYLMVLEAP